ncbi:MerR family transcriptional regulator [Paenibacillus taichungensis]|uniref:MerR family transcriptional regulator n=1 Tax=Paenibacillus taichungensis TaxID=484184 RepID=UPI002871606C|nr:MerR family transcriptional regulator [Paenibacillus taichungensis]MDR9748573.1 MerR family transcriptional regulator [Paenibacillus taichungensis]
MSNISKRYYSAGSFAKLTSTTKRTLHYYDNKGLLKPSGYNEKGYRSYSDDDLFRLHQILTLKYLDYSLDEISEYLEQDAKDFNTSLKLQYELLLKKQQHTQRIVDTVERAIAIMDDNDTIEPELIMVMIRSIQHEQEQKQWLSDHLPEELVQSMLMSELSSDEQIQVNRELMIAYNDLLAMYKQGLPPEHPLVQEPVLAIKLLLEQLLGHSLQELATNETGKVLKDLDTQLFPNFEPDFMNYFSEALVHLLRRMWEEKMNE